MMNEIKDKDYLGLCPNEKYAREVIRNFSIWHIMAYYEI